MTLSRSITRGNKQWIADDDGIRVMHDHRLASQIPWRELEYVTNSKLTGTHTILRITSTPNQRHDFVRALRLEWRKRDPVKWERNRHKNHRSVILGIFVYFPALLLIPIVGMWIFALIRLGHIPKDVSDVLTRGFAVQSLVIAVFWAIYFVSIRKQFVGPGLTSHA